MVTPRGGRGSRPAAAVSAMYARALLDYLREHGIDPSGILSGSAIRNLDHPQGRTRFPLKEWLGMIDAAIRATGDDELPLRIGMSVNTRHVGLLGYLLMSCATLGEAIAQFERYSRLIGDISTTRTIRRRGKVDLVWECAAGVPHNDAMPKLQLAARTALARGFVGLADARVTAHFQFRRPRDTAPYDRFFGRRTLFDQPQTKLELPIEYLQAPIATANAELRQLAVRQAEVLLSWQGDEPDFLRDLKTALARGLPAGHVSLAELAATLHTSERTLQRRLEDHGRSFRSVLDEVRYAEARRYLSNAGISLVQVAFMLGYTDQSSFHSAFRRWAGMTPNQFRAGGDNASRVRGAHPTRMDVVR